VVAVETATWDAVDLGESMQFIEAGVARQMAPQPVSVMPARLVDQDRHSAETGTLGR